MKTKNWGKNDGVMIFKSFVKLPECANFDKHIQFSTINCAVNLLHSSW